MANARAWALRCHLELQQHPSAAFTTLTYSDDHVPPTLERRHLQLWLKRIRKALPSRSIRFFASGEYGETTERPHYHAIMYGLSSSDRDVVENTWGLGHAHTVNVTPAAIAYVAGYAAKKIGYKQTASLERVDPETGEVYHWVPPFIQMSRRPGIGGHARQHLSSWRLYAIHNGAKMPVPRFLHAAWKANATPLQKELLENEKYELTKNSDTSAPRLLAALAIAEAKQAIKASRRKL
jgi:hypothetical protein